MIHLASSSMRTHTSRQTPNLKMRPDQNTVGWKGEVVTRPGVHTRCFYGYQSLHPRHISPRLFLGVWAYQLSCQTLLRAKCIDWFLIAPELGGERKWRKAFVFLFSNLTQILNLSAIYIIPFRFMNYKEESISLDKNTLKQLCAFFLTFYPAIVLIVSFILSIPHCRITITVAINVYATVMYCKHFLRKTQASDS